MRKPAEILKDIDLARANSQIDIAQVSPANRPGVEGIIRRGERDIVEFEKEYKDTIADSLALVTVSGPNSRDFGAIASNKVLTIDNLQIVNEIADEIQRRTGRPGLGDQEYLVLLSTLNEIKHRYNIASIPPIRDQGIAQVVANIPVREAVNKILVKNYGYQLHSAIIQRLAAQKALDAKFAGNTLVVLVSGYEGLDPTILPPPFAEIRADGEQTEESVTKELSKLKNKKAVKPATKKGGPAAKENTNE